jgi:hypothetical protein
LAIGRLSASFSMPWALPVAEVVAARPSVLAARAAAPSAVVAWAAVALEAVALEAVALEAVASEVAA